MTAGYDIAFPHLGICIEELPYKITVFGIDIAFYGILIAIAVLLAVFLSVSRAKKTGQKPGDYYDLAIIGVISAIIGARIYYILFNLDYFLEDPVRMIQIRNGGLAVYGGIIGGFLAAFVVCRVKKIRLLQVLDTVAPCIALGQAIGRWGNFFNCEAFGDYTDSLFAMQIKLSSAGGVINSNIKDHIININGTDYIQVHPTFLYESVWCLLLFIFIMLFRKYQDYNGEVLMWYLGAYGLERTAVEGLRTDSLMIWNTDIRVSQVLSAALFLICLTLLIINRVRYDRLRNIHY